MWFSFSKIKWQNHRALQSIFQSFIVFSIMFNILDLPINLSLLWCTSDLWSTLSSSPTINIHTPLKYDQYSNTRPRQNFTFHNILTVLPSLYCGVCPSIRSLTSFSDTTFTLPNHVLVTTPMICTIVVLVSPSGFQRLSVLDLEINEKQLPGQGLRTQNTKGFSHSLVLFQEFIHIVCFNSSPQICLLNKLTSNFVYQC